MSQRKARRRTPTGPRMTIPTQLVLRVLLGEPTKEMYGLEICAGAGLPSGTIHPILARLEGLGWVQSRWEDIDPEEEGRPRRRYYQLTKDGAESARIALAQITTPVSTLGGALRPAPRPAGGNA
jgi:PadR family transcriptional regulator, regulatory protein PadR